MTFKKCRNEGCEVQIEVRNTAEGWRPFEESGNKHNCQFSDYAKKQRVQKPSTWNEVVEQAEDHGNENVEAIGRFAEVIAPKTEYVDHTAKGANKVKIFYSGYSTEVEKEYSEFLTQNNGKIKTQGAHDHVTRLPEATEDGELLFTIYLYYEEMVKQ